MARIRSIKPEFWTSEQVMECSPTARLLFIGIWNFCDDNGRHPFMPKQIKALVFPGDDFSADTIRRMLDELSSNGLISVYTIENKDFLQVTGWHHQKIDKPQAGKYPAPLRDHSSNGQRMLSTDRIGSRGDKDGNKEQSSYEDCAPAEPSPIDEDPKTVLFQSGLTWLSAATKKPEEKLRSLLGRWLSAMGGDAHASALLGIIRDAKRERKAEPIAWIEQMVVGRKARDGPIIPLQNRKNISIDTADKLQAVRTIYDRRNSEQGFDDTDEIPRLDFAVSRAADC